MRPPPGVRDIVLGLLYFQRSNWSRTRPRLRQTAEIASRGLPAGGPLRLPLRGRWKRGQSLVHPWLLATGARAAPDLVRLWRAVRDPGADRPAAAASPTRGTARAGDLWRRW